MYNAIQLTDAEQVIADEIHWNNEQLPHDATRTQRNGELMLLLTQSLAERNAIPESRQRYMTEAEYNIGGRGASRMQGFERNGCQGDDIFRHPHFLKYLRYIVFGCDLPQSGKERFKKAVDDCGTFTSGDLAPLCAAAVSLTRSLRLDPKQAAEEFFKLAIDLGLSVSTAATIRSEVIRVKPRG